jgi:hypothetical protein
LDSAGFEIIATRNLFQSRLTDLRFAYSSDRQLSHLLDNVQGAAERLGNSRRWKLANPGTAIKAKLSRNKVLTGYGHLDRIVAAYSQWRASHPEIAKIDDPIETAPIGDPSK